MRPAARMDQETSKGFSCSSSHRCVNGRHPSDATASSGKSTRVSVPSLLDLTTVSQLPKTSMDTCLVDAVHKPGTHDGVNIKPDTVEANSSSERSSRRGKKCHPTSPVHVFVGRSSSGKQIATEPIEANPNIRLPMSLSSSALTRSLKVIDSDSAPTKGPPIENCKKNLFEKGEADIRATTKEQPKHKFVVSYFRETCRGSSYDWRTKFIDRIDVDTGDDEDLESEYGDLRDDQVDAAQVRPDIVCGARAEGKRVVVAIKPQQTESVSSSHTLAISQTVVESNMSKGLSRDNSPDPTRRKSGVVWNNSKELGTESTTTVPSSRLHSQDTRPLRHLFDYMPSFSTTMSTSGERRSSAFSEGFEVGSGTSRIKFATKDIEGTQTSFCRRKRRTSSSGSFRSLKLMVKRNLVATLIGAYIIFSIIFMIALMVPYIYRVVNSKNSTVKSSLIDDVTLTSQASYLIDEIELKSLSKAISDRNKVHDSDGHHKSEPSLELVVGHSGTPSMLLMPMGNVVGAQNKHAVHVPESKSIDQSSVATLAPGRIAASDMRSELTHKVSVGTQTDSFESDQVVSISSSGTSSRGTSDKVVDNSSIGTGNLSTNNITLSSVSTMMRSDNASTVGASNSRRNVKSLAELWDIRVDRECEPIKISLCTHSLELSSSELGAQSHKVKFPYSSTLMPNHQNSIQQSQIETTLEKYAPLVDVRCYALMPLFLCSIHVPKCIQVDRNSTASSMNKHADLSTDHPMAMLVNKKGSTNPNAARAIDTSLPSNPDSEALPRRSLDAGPIDEDMTTSASNERDSGSGTSSSTSRIAAFLASTMPKLSPNLKATPMRPKEPSTARLVPPCRSVCKGKSQLLAPSLPSKRNPRSSFLLIDEL